MNLIEDPEAIHEYLSPLFARGQGDVASGLIGSRSVTVDGDTIRLAITHARLGSYTIVLEGAIALTNQEYDVQQMGFSTLSKHEGNDSTVTISLRRRTIFGPDGITYSVKHLYVEAEQLDAPAGACKACGNARFQLRMSANLEVEDAGDNKFTWSGGEINLQNVLVLLACSKCSTPHPGASMGSLTGIAINGHEFGRGSDTVKISDLIAGMPS